MGGFRLSFPPMMLKISKLLSVNQKWYHKNRTRNKRVSYDICFVTTKRSFRSYTLSCSIQNNIIPWFSKQRIRSFKTKYRFFLELCLVQTVYFRIVSTKSEVTAPKISKLGAKEYQNYFYWLLRDHGFRNTEKQHVGMKQKMYI